MDAKRRFEAVVPAVGRSGIALLLSCTAAGLQAAPVEGNGLTVSLQAEPWSRWQTRVAVQIAPNDWRGANGSQTLRKLRVFGDYYFSPAAATRPAGFRATSGLLIGARSSLSLADGAGGGGRGAGWAAPALPVAPGADASPSDSTGAVPYVGVGYTGASAGGGFSFSADLGLMALRPRSAVQFGRAGAAGQSLDDVLRELRLSPALQLGVSYSF